MSMIILGLVKSRLSEVDLMDLRNSLFCLAEVCPNIGLSSTCLFISSVSVLYFVKVCHREQSCSRLPTEVVEGEEDERQGEPKEGEETTTHKERGEGQEQEDRLTRRRRTHSRNLGDKGGK